MGIVNVLFDGIDIFPSNMRNEAEDIDVIRVRAKGRVIRIGEDSPF